MTTVRKKLINAVDRERGKLKMSDRKFSILILEISPSYWCLLKADKRPLTLNLLTTFMQKLPQVTPQVMVYVKHQGGDGKNQIPANKSLAEAK